VLKNARVLHAANMAAVAAVADKQRSSVETQLLCRKSGQLRVGLIPWGVVPSYYLRKNRTRSTIFIIKNKFIDLVAIIQELLKILQSCK